MNTKLYCYFLFLLPCFVFSQNYNMSNGGSISTCTGTFYDSGGPDGEYSNSQNLTYTICPGTAGQYISLNFTSFDTENNYDKLTIYHGSNTSNPPTVLTGDLSSALPLITSYAANGCLTLVFTSDASITKQGWAATISCRTTTVHPPSLCFGATAFCSASTYNFANTSGTTLTAEVGPNYGCLQTRPNPIWYFMRMSTAGPVTLNVTQTQNANGTGTSLDIDFALWGPFTSTSQGCTTVQSGTLAPAACGYSNSHTETFSIANAQVGEIYLIILTNFSKDPGYIRFQQTDGTGQADCSIVPLSINLNSYDVFQKNGSNQIEWTSIHEQDIFAYELERSEDGNTWTTIRDVEIIEDEASAHKSYNIKDYDFKNTWNYYRLVELRTDGSRENLGTKAIDNRIESKEVLKIVNTLGQEIDRSFSGLKIIVFTDGTSIKVM